MEPNEPNKPRLRMTEQRRVILEELRKVKTHPSADQIYEMVRKRLPHISLATVYRNLDVLSEAGEILTLELSGTQRRYDGDVRDHHHARCKNCGKIIDVPSGVVPMPEMTALDLDGFMVSGCRMELVGLCKSCLEKAHEH